jgi:Kef-type K+ transport system membrane component KefB
VVLESVADLGLIFFLFMVGLELDLRAMRRTGRQAMTIAAAGITVPFAAGVGVSLVLHRTIVPGGSFGAFVVFMGVAMSITAFPVLARILAERRLLTTDVGQMAMAAAAVNDVVAWILLALAVALSGSRDKSPAIAAWVLLTGLGFVVLMFALVRPLMAAVARHATEHAPVPEIFVAVTLAGVLASGFATDAIGIHSIFGAFVFGLVVPKDGPFAELLIHKIEDLVSVLMLPLYFATSGLKTNIGSIHGATSAGLLVLVVATACAGKILGTFAVAKLFRMSSRKSLTLGILMNTKGLVELIVLNIGKDRGVRAYISFRTPNNLNP